MNRRISRRSVLAAGLCGTAGFSCSRLTADESKNDFDIIDCHTHFYDPARAEGVPWPGKGTSLYRTVLPEHLRALKQFRRVTGTVIVEASPWVEDNAWLLDLAKDDPFVVGIIGNLTPGSTEFGKNLKRFAANELFRGIRLSSKSVAECLDRNDFADLNLLVDHDLTLDVNGGPEMPAIVARLAVLLPELRIVVNHIGNVRITRDAPPKDWQLGIQSAAKQPSVFCKVSALVEGASRDGQQAPGELDFYRPYVDVVWNAFGDDRVVYGSNWPVSEKAADYETLQRIALQYASEKGSEATSKFCSLNSKRAYKWADRPGRK